MAEPETQQYMDAVVLQGPGQIRVEKRPKPVIQAPTDAIIKVLVAGICGSELHPYRGHQKTSFGHIMGHEFTGLIEQVGTEVQHFLPGQRVICTFSTSCLSCWFCQNGYTNRCVKSLALGTQQFDGGQAQYARVPDADGTLLQAPESMPDNLLVMMSDIFPTGYYGTMRALETLQQLAVHTSLKDYKGTGSIQKQIAFTEVQPLSEMVFVCIGCGIVGFCAIVTAVSKGVGTVFCVDTVDDRLAEAAAVGGKPLKLGKDDIKSAIMDATNGRGADAVVESVGNKAALRSAFDLLRPCGALSSIGFHQGELPFTALECYQKNLNINLGRAPVRAVFEDALEIFVANKDKFSGVISHVLPMKNAAEGYTLFDKQKAKKVLLVPETSINL